MSLKTTDFIEEFNQAIDAKNIGAVHAQVISALDNTVRTCPLDWMALGRAAAYHPEFYDAWHLLTIQPMFIKDVDSVLMSAFITANIAAKVEQGRYTEKSTSLKDNGSKEIDYTRSYLATTQVVSAYHPDEDVRAIADFAVRHLEERLGKKMGLIPA